MNFQPLLVGLPSYMEAVRHPECLDFFRVLLNVEHDGKIYPGREWIQKCMMEEVIGIASETAIYDPAAKSDFFRKFNIQESGDCYASREPEYELATMEKNAALIQNKTMDGFKQTDVCVIVGGGPSARRTAKTSEFKKLRQREDVSVITVSSSQNVIEGDYYLGAELAPPGPARLNGCVTENTVGIFHIHANNDYFKRDWKELRFYEGIHEIDHGLEKFWAALTVSYDAIQFAVKHLGAKHLVFIGFEGAASIETGKYHDSDPGPINADRAYLSRGLDGKMWIIEPAGVHIVNILEACAWLLFLHDIYCWNCSDGGIMLRNFNLCDIKTFRAWMEKTQGVMSCKPQIHFTGVGQGFERKG